VPGGALSRRARENGFVVDERVTAEVRGRRRTAAEVTQLRNAVVRERPQSADPPTFVGHVTVPERHPGHERRERALAC